MNQKHLTYKEVTNYGCFYTPFKYTQKLLQILEMEVESLEEYSLLDSSCGYGSFFDYDYKTIPNRIIGGDIDEKATETAFCRNPKVEYFNCNALLRVNRENYNLKDNDKLIIIGNPPYNDITSKVKMDIKQGYVYQIDEDIKTRDLGISFMLSYNKLKADFVCILHPLSYLIKKANFELLKPFFKNYSLINSLIINSQDFAQTSKGTGFPIILALYKKNILGTNYEDIMKRDFKTIDQKEFNLNFDSIKNYISKYPNKTKNYDGRTPLFWTMRDINALKRSKTFVGEYSENTIVVDINKLQYYCYVDVFKDYIQHIPYYFGNCDVMINYKEFIKIKDVFIAKSISKHPFLKEYFNNFETNANDKLLENYFNILLGGNYVH